MNFLSIADWTHVFLVSQFINKRFLQTDQSKAEASET